MTRRVYDPRQHSLFKPDSDWEPPTGLPVIASGCTVAIDTETRDIGLQEHMGPGWVHRKGHLCGVSWASSCGSVGYAPIRHPDTSGLFPEDVVIDWLQDLDRRCTIVMQNAAYDLGWTGLRPTSRIGDTHTMAVLLDENRDSYSLSSICEWLGIPGKDDRLLREAVRSHGGNPSKPQEHLWQLPARYVGPYAEQDAVATLEAAQRMTPMMETQKLLEAYDLETRLTPHVIEMRRRGIRIDLDKVEQNQARMRRIAAQELSLVRQHLNMRRDVTIDDVRSPKWLENVFTELGVPFPRTEKTKQGSFDKDWLSRCAHPVAVHVARARRYEDGAEKFLGTYILDYVDRGRIHAEIHQLRDADEGVSSGTRTYRFSYSNPPLQQAPRAGTEEDDIGVMFREAFLPEKGEVWAAPDFSGQEVRMLIHYGTEMKLTRAQEACDYYTNDDSADFHSFVAELTGLPRKRAKDINFARAYGAGAKKFALMADMSIEEATESMRQYDERMPFISEFAKKASVTAERRGYVKLIDGRRCRFDNWEASWIDTEEWKRGRELGKLMTPCKLSEAATRQFDPEHPWHGKRLRRAGVHKAGNRVIQGSSAVQTKMALLACAEEGYTMLIQIHDEFGVSVGSRADSERVAEIMENCLQLRVPSKVDRDHGTSWGDAKYTYEEAAARVKRDLR